MGFREMFPTASTYTCTFECSWMTAASDLDGRSYKLLHVIGLMIPTPTVPLPPRRRCAVSLLTGLRSRT
jgi:hypothetical protein